MKLGYTIVYVPDVPDVADVAESLAFFGPALQPHPFSSPCSPRPARAHVIGRWRVGAA